MDKTELPLDKERNIKPIEMYDEMSSSYLSYAMSVIVSRALTRHKRWFETSSSKNYYMQCIKVVLIGQ